MSLKLLTLPLVGESHCHEDNQLYTPIYAEGILKLVYKNMGRNNLFEFLRYLGVLMINNVPYVRP